MEHTILQLMATCLLTAAGAYVIKILIYAVIQLSPRQQPGAWPQLTPAQAAFLLRNGDMVHTMIVITVDLLHRAVKETTDIQLHPYEKEMWWTVKNFTTQWASNTAGIVVPVKDIRNPLQWLLRLNTLKAFFGGTIKNVVSGVIKDPRNIRKYFELGGVLRLAFQMYTSNTRPAVESSIKQELRAKGLIVNEGKRRAGTISILVLILGMVAALFFIDMSMSALPQLHAHWLFFSCFPLLNAVIIRLVLELPSLLPSFDEFSKVAAELHRGGFRMTLLRTLLLWAKLILAVLVLLVVTLLSIAELLVASLIHIPAPIASGGLFGFSVIALCIVQLLIDAHSLESNELRTLLAEQKLKELTNKLKTVSPLNVLKETVSSSTYDALFSELVAVYGIDTLWLLS